MGLAIAILANMIGGATYFIGKIALTGFPPAILVCFRTLISLPFLAIATPRGWSKNATRADWSRLFIIGTVGLALPHIVSVYGLKDTASLNAAVLIGIEPIVIVILSIWILRERPTNPQMAGIAFSVIGAALVVSGGDPSELRFDPTTRGNLLLALSGMLWALYTVLMKPTLERVHPVAVTGVTSLISLPFLLPIGALEWDMFDSNAAFQPAPLGAAIALGVGISFASSSMWNWSLKRISASQMASLIFVQPVTGAVLSLLGGESVPALTWVGGAFVFVGVYLAYAIKSPHSAP